MPKKKRSRAGPPRDPTAWCSLHRRYMNDCYIRQRGCLCRRQYDRKPCRHLSWLPVRKENA